MTAPSSFSSLPRGAGILLHLSSLPGSAWIGELGPPAARFIGFLRRAGQRYWQVLPLGPTDPAFGNSPYTSYSAFAGNPLLVGVEGLYREGLLTKAERDAGTGGTAGGTVDYRAAARAKGRLLRAATERIPGVPAIREAYEAFCRRHGDWLEDYALFMAIKREFGMRIWTSWPEPLKRRDPASLARWRRGRAEALHRERASQFLFFRQWEDLRRDAAEAGVRLIGDLPIYVSFDSADVWAHPDFFDLEPAGLRPRNVAGVPPDYFSETGQRWGNPLYDWHDPSGALRGDLLAWWTARIRHLLERVDLVRFDHFRGIEAYWEIPAEEDTAVRGRWKPGPGRAFLKHLQQALGGLPLVAEDLGVITPEVEALRDAFGLPGMRVLQFGFDGDERNPHLPENYGGGHCIAYTGTHDNDTTEGWAAGLDPQARGRLLAYLGCGPEEKVGPALIRRLYGSSARCVIVPLQDHLGLGSGARLNRPGRPDGNWVWRCPSGGLDGALADRLRALCEETDR